MSYPRRAHGRGYRTPSSKKIPSRIRRDSHYQTGYNFIQGADPEDVAHRTLIQLEHLGSQRFPLPPYMDHYQRWIKDLKMLIASFESSIPKAVDNIYREKVSDTLAKIEDELSKGTEAEKKNSLIISTQAERLAKSEEELKALERDYKAELKRAKNEYEQSIAEVSKEIESLNKKRITLLQRRLAWVQRIFARSRARDVEEIEDEASSKRSLLSQLRRNLETKLKAIKEDYEAERRRLTTDNERLRDEYTRIYGNSSDDSVDLRRTACQELSHTVIEALGRAGLNEKVDKS